MHSTPHRRRALTQVATPPAGLGAVRQFRESNRHRTARLGLSLEGIGQTSVHEKVRGVCEELVQRHRAAPRRGRRARVARLHLHLGVELAPGMKSRASGESKPRSRDAGSPAPPHPPHRRTDTHSRGRRRARRQAERRCVRLGLRLRLRLRRRQAPHFHLSGGRAVRRRRGRRRSARSAPSQPRAAARARGACGASYGAVRSVIWRSA